MEARSPEQRAALDLLLWLSRALETAGDQRTEAGVPRADVQRRDPGARCGAAALRPRANAVTGRAPATFSQQQRWLPVAESRHWHLPTQQEPGMPCAHVWPFWPQT